MASPESLGLVEQVRRVGEAAGVDQRGGAEGQRTRQEDNAPVLRAWPTACSVLVEKRHVVPDLVRDHSAQPDQVQIGFQECPRPGRG